VTLRARHAEDALLDGDLSATHAERVAAAVAQDVSPIDDVRSTRDYRLRVTQNLLRELVLELGARP
jgi:CO/xanthine dehydrogenase FAD-binding subunit